ncbi:ppe family protein [Mycobacterium ulcerans str. Harvey]|uniref:Ppe family protein n=1 Tax=Mycobacterium ulcerans str. Harvey TaxID=1299332 RepID=A0ABN0R991_MYCUL|nr:ppe family protein [Mycobacterium ulcerans str. Harvey]
MWAQDAMAMYGYAGSSAAATRLSEFLAPQHNTNPAGLLAQQSTLAQLMSAVPNVLQGLASSNTSASAPSGLLSTLLSGNASWLCSAAESRSRRWCSRYWRWARTPTTAWLARTAIAGQQRAQQPGRRGCRSVGRRQSLQHVGNCRHQLGQR